MNFAWVIKGPVLTEKALALQKRGVWSFFVHRKANKAQIKKALTVLFDVHPQKISVINVKPKKKYLVKERRAVLKSGQRKALVWLPREESIKEIKSKE